MIKGIWVLTSDTCKDIQCAQLVPDLGVLPEALEVCLVIVVRETLTFALLFSFSFSLWQKDRRVNFMTASFHTFATTVML